MSLRRPNALVALVSMLATLGACEFEGGQDMAPIEMNSCSSTANCERGSACRGSLCVADSADGTLTIALRVTPVPTSVGAPALPVVLPSFQVSGPIDKEFPLPETTDVDFRVLDHGMSIEANVTFTPVMAVAGLPAPSVAVSVAPSATQSADADFTVQLLSRVKYRMLVLPSDMRLPPSAHEFKARDSGRQDVEIDLDTHEQALTITGDAADRELLVTAFDQASGEPISSTASVVKGKAVLVFAAGAESLPYWVQIRAAQSYAAEPATNATQCDTDTPAFPSFSINGSDIEKDAKGAWMIALPKLPERIRYEGTVALCPEEQSNTSTITALPVTLHSEALMLDAGPALHASFDATTSATYDKDADALRFCVQAMPGEYYVRATPPASMRCALFAERIPIEAPKGKEASTGLVLSLPKAAYLAGKVLTSSAMPLSNASVEARALGRADVVELPEGDRSVTIYNRSSDTLTDSLGSFKLPVDLGSYDVIVKPLAESGFPWQVRTDVNVGLGAREKAFATMVDMPSPVVVTGSLLYEGSGESAQMAEIEAYALIPIDAAHPDAGERAVPIGKTTADADGRFTLLLPVSVDAAW